VVAGQSGRDQEAGAERVFEAIARAPAALIKAHRTGDVATIAAEDSPFGVATVRKRLWYPTCRDRLRGVLRTTALARSRVAGEAASLARLAALDLQPDLLLAFGERRRRGFLLDSFLCTRWLRVRPLDQLLREERDPAEREAWLTRLGRFVGRMHAAGFVDRDLHLRNLLAGADGLLVKVDSPFGTIPASWWRAGGKARDLRDLVADVRAVASVREVALLLAAVTV
jgi:tRNA A-37 threonylcarbamoyl transferase component Bud32